MALYRNCSHDDGVVMSKSAILRARLLGDVRRGTTGLPYVVVHPSEGLKPLIIDGGYAFANKDIIDILDNPVNLPFRFGDTVKHRNGDIGMVCGYHEGDFWVRGAHINRGCKASLLMPWDVI